jgi:hypothetical protein
MDRGIPQNIHPLLNTLSSDLWTLIYEMDPTYHHIYRRLWTHDIKIQKVFVKSFTTTLEMEMYLFYSNGIHRKWLETLFHQSSQSLTRWFWVLLSDTRDKQLDHHLQLLPTPSFTSLRFFDTLVERDEFISSLVSMRSNESNISNISNISNMSIYDFISFYKQRFGFEI